METRTEIFNGTPAMFYDTLMAFRSRCIAAGRGIDVSLREPRRLVFVPGKSLPRSESALTPESGWVVAEIRSEQNVNAVGILEAAALPGNRAKIVAGPEPEAINIFDPIWVDLLAYLREQGWLSDPARPGASGRAGRKALACNVWLDYIVNVKKYKIGSRSDNNELFQMWKKLYHFETGKSPDNPDAVGDPWRGFTAVAARKK